MSPKPILYSLDYSPPARTVWLTAKYIGLELEIRCVFPVFCVCLLYQITITFRYRNVDIFNKQHLSEEYLKMNPQHTVPTLDDNGVYLWESAPICTYLIAKYGPADGCALYPTDLVQRARIDQRLYFNAAVLFGLQRTCSIRVFFKKQAQLPAELFDGVREAFDHVEGFLQGGAFLVGDTLTLADLAMSTTVNNILEWAPLEKSERYKRIVAWLRRIESELPYYAELNSKQVAAYGAEYRQVLAINRAHADKQ